MPNGRTPKEKFHDADGLESKLLVVFDEVLEMKAGYASQPEICAKKFVGIKQVRGWAKIVIIAILFFCLGVGVLTVTNIPFVSRIFGAVMGAI